MKTQTLSSKTQKYIQTFSVVFLVWQQMRTLHKIVFPTCAICSGTNFFFPFISKQEFLRDIGDLDGKMFGPFLFPIFHSIVYNSIELPPNDLNIQAVCGYNSPKCSRLKEKEEFSISASYHRFYHNFGCSTVGFSYF